MKPTPETDAKKNREEMQCHHLNRIGFKCEEKTFYNSASFKACHKYFDDYKSTGDQATTKCTQYAMYDYTDANFEGCFYAREDYATGGYKAAESCTQDVFVNPSVHVTGEEQ